MLNGRANWPLEDGSTLLCAMLHPCRRHSLFKSYWKSIGGERNAWSDQSTGKKNKNVSQKKCPFIIYRGQLEITVSG